MKKFTTLDASYATYNACMLIVRDKGYKVEVKCYGSANTDREVQYFAARDDILLCAASAPELLGIVVLWETYGDKWNQQDPDIMSEIISEEEVDE